MTESNIFAHNPRPRCSSARVPKGISGWAARMDMRLEYSQSATRLPTAGKTNDMMFYSTAARPLDVLYISKRCASPKYRFRQTWMGTSVNTS